MGDVIYCGAWVRVGGLSRRYKLKPCAFCKKATCAVMWRNIRTDEAVCTDCADMEAIHWYIQENKAAQQFLRGEL